MRRHPMLRVTVSGLALALLGAPCSTSGPQPRDFPAGALVIPMDNCYQKRDSSAAAQTQSCNTASDDGVFRAYGLVYFLLQKGITVYWTIDGATPKAGVTAPDVVVAAPSSGPVVRKYDWTSHAVADFSPAFPSGVGITYLGGPFIVDPAQKAQVLALLAGDPDIARIRNKESVDIHEVQAPFHANQVRPLSGTPPRLAILNVNPQPYRKTSVDVMYRYAVAAGFDWPCTPANGDCAGGLGPGCDAAVIQKYLANTLCGGSCNRTACSSCASWVSPAITTAQFNPPGTPGKVYDVLCDGDFTAGSGSYVDTQLAKGGYKLVWAPHWDTGGVDPAAPAGAVLGQQLRNLASFVAAGNNLFAECAAIGALETGVIDGTGTLLKGVPQTQFQSTAGMKSTTNGDLGTLQPFISPQHPNLQVGDFNFAQVGGAITNYYPDRAGTPASFYRPSVERLISSSVANQAPWDIAGSLQVSTSDGVKVGTVAYLGGHDYSPAADGSAKGQTAGTRIVLNTLFNLGFACADPNTTCSTGYPSYSACGIGALKCSAAGGLVCVPTVLPGTQPEICGNGIDDNCDGQIDEGCNQTCTNGAVRSCTEGNPPELVCAAGSQTCANQSWGACLGLRLKSPEACNGKDDDCNGLVDDGTLCGLGQACTGGVCLPTSCDLERRCPEGYACTGGPPAHCTAVACPSVPCGAGLVCRGTPPACVDPCAGVHCGAGATCSGGVCFGGACYTNGCPAGEICTAGRCAADPCAAVTCPSGTFCRAGDCVISCASVECAPGTHCGIDGACEPGPGCEPACGSGLVCQGGACVADPACAGIGCGQGQFCQGGACRDAPCAAVTCPVGSSCQGGQCQGSTPQATVPKETTAKGGCGGCASGGGADFLALCGALALWPRLRRSRRRTAPAAGRGFGKGLGNGFILGLATLALGSSACGKSSTESCPSGATPCGTLCCAPGYACNAGSCAPALGSPSLAAIAPAAAGVGGVVNLTLSGSGFLTGAVARLSGTGVPAEVALNVTSDTSAAMALDLTEAALGTVEVRVVNPDHLSSNAVPLALTADAAPVALNPTALLQDAGATTVAVTGRGFASGMQVSLTRGASTTTYTASVTSETQATVAIDPGPLAVSVYDLAVTNPGGNRSPAVKLAIVEGTPVLTSLDRACAVQGTSFVGTITGQFLYPTSTVHVSAGGDSALISRCTLATPTANGQCQQGKLDGVVDLAGVTPGTYQVWVVNPGATPLQSAKVNFTVAPATCP